MAERQDLAQKRTGRDSILHAFVSHRGLTDRDMSSGGWKRTAKASLNEDMYTSHADCIIETLSPSHACRVSVGRDLENTQRLLASVREAVEDGTLTDNEAAGVVEFVISQFIGRRFDCIMSDVFGHGQLRKRTLHGMTGRMEHGRKRSITR